MQSPELAEDATIRNFVMVISESFKSFISINFSYVFKKFNGVSYIFKKFNESLTVLQNLISNKI